MIVQCQNCETRFHVADARIPAKGARVRCSRCHHRFHITPSSAPPAQPEARPAAQGSAREPLRGGENVREEDQLDNPEFLFDKPEKPQKAEARASEKPRPRAIEREHATVQLPEPPPLSPPEPETPPPIVEERVFEAGKTAQEMLDAGIPELEPTRLEIGGSLDEPGLAGDLASPRASQHETVDEDAVNERDFLGDDASTPSPLAAEPASAPPASAAPSSRAAPARVDIDALAAELGEDEDSSFADWDPLATPAVASLAPGAPGPFSAPPAPERETVFDRPDLPAGPAAKQRAVPQMPVVDPEAAGPAALILRIAAAIVGLALLGAASRLLWLQHDEVPPTAEAVQAAGWMAVDLETFLARDATGERVLIVRGNLFPEGSAPPPEVEVHLIGAEGNSLVEAPHTWLERIDDAEIAPERLSPRLASSSGEIAGFGQQVTGFTAVLTDPPPGVRRVEVVLRARATPPAGTATAGAPPAEPPQAAPTETAAPDSSKLPPEPADADVVPAAPAPEE